MARFALLLLMISAGISWLCAQAPIPAGQATTAATLSGTVRGSRGEALAAVPVSVKNAQSVEVLSVKTNVDGEFRVSLQPGRYTVTAKAGGYALASKDVSLDSSQPAKIDLRLNQLIPDDQPKSGGGNRRPGEVYIPPVKPPGAGGMSIPEGEYVDAKSAVKSANTDVAGRMHIGTAASPSQTQNQIPAGEPSQAKSIKAANSIPAHPATVTDLTPSGPPGDVPIPGSGAVAVSGGFASWSDLAAWLNGQSGRNLRLQAILPSAQANENLFVWVAHTGADQNFVVSADDINSSNDLQKILKAYPQAAVIGLAQIQDHRYLVLRSNP